MRLAILGLVGLIGASAHAEPIPYLQKPTVSFRAYPYVADPHPLNPNVHYVGGYELTAHGTDQFMGLSDLQLFPDGDGLQVEAISDWGAAVLFELKPDGQGGFLDSPLEIDSLRGEDGLPFRDKFAGDSEDIAYDPATLDRYVSFEGFQRIMKYTGSQDGSQTPWRQVGQVLPVSGLPSFPENEGMEGLTYIHEPGGDSLLIGVEAGGFWRCRLTDYACTEVLGPKAPGFLYLMTSLAVIDYADPKLDHDILALYRYYDPFNGPRNILTHLRLEGDRLIKVEDMLKIAPPLPYDNFEGVAAVKTATGYRLYLICDGLHDADKPKILIYDWTRPASQ